MTELLARSSVDPTLKRDVDIARRRHARWASAATAAIMTVGGLGFLVVVGGPLFSVLSIFVS